ncbi:hypothetical protein TRIATDRAFT_85599 [Trichoderma atroviride IMI 206040]|uniref:Uncharacterized protein n=1 Tax=Hypocrea atroviridis (strain ATCC 20476 / IMI 206040) TaxID=452589 RepID=G9P5L5_HYPAI|nr:uncharacterized protein TRIATDRAFT_85599 [Trichoderma atroviride IMI 206040]EHK40527.1 hypothetical protein TRIATDRAFT_85599 [Trichoderma atroviride IMI 206040]
MSDLSIERTTRLHELDLQYQKSLHETDLINRDEESRRLQLRVFLLQDENTQLQDRCAAKDDEIKTLSRRNDKLRVKLDEAKSQNTSEDEQMKENPIEARPKTRTEPIAATADSSIEENAALAKELQDLRSEVKLLRLRAADDEKSESKSHQQEYLAQEPASKSQSNSNNSNDTNEEVIRLQSMLDKSTERITEEERHRERMKLNHQKQLYESERQNNKLEGKVLALEKKLKDAQTELREFRQASHSGLKDRPGDGLDSTQDAATKSHDRDQSPPAEKDKVPRKRVARKRTTEQAKIGEKSTFSITPLLNKIKGTGGTTGRPSLTFDDILLQEGDDPSPLRAAKKPEARSTAAAPATGLVASTPLRPREKLGSKSSETQSQPKATEVTSGKVPAPKSSAPSQGTEDEKPEDAKGEGVSKAADSKETALHKRIKLHESTTTTTTDRGVDLEQKKRRRKLINKANTIIEEDETGEAAQPTEAQPGRARKLKSAVGSAFSSGTASKPFSPLKRHKRGMNASFLV